MHLKEVVKKLNDLAPVNLAESWDNVGLLVQPSTPKLINTILLTNDLTEVVMEEAETCQANLILSYHPPLFRPIKTVTQANWKVKLVYYLS